MRAVIQRVSKAAVSVNGSIAGSIDGGYMILLGVTKDDTEKQAEILALKTVSLRVFSDSEGKMNLSLLQTGKQALVISQFTLCADTRKGNRPSFSQSAPPETAKRLYELYIAELERLGVKRVEQGCFGADMAVSLVNDGPVTICLDTDTWLTKE